MAAVQGHIEIVQYLLSCGADINAQCINNESVLHTAIYHGQTDIAKYLISKGANIESIDNDHWTPLHYAANGNRIEEVKFLIKHNANINCRSNCFYTPLVVSSNEEVFKYLYSINPSTVFISPFEFTISPPYNFDQNYLEWFHYISSFSIPDQVS